ncbi:MAG: LysR family transcriptional regulator [Defluviitaleaceae bacterium]|nr:LysR family transcriptional regulator [Defluviitaleaceae bacterium]
MNTKYIFEFTQIVEHGSFSEAAHELFISQSSLSKHIHALEEYLGFRLFDRSSRKVQLTTEGKIFLPFAEIICDAERNAIKTLRDYGFKSKKRVVIAGLVVMSFYGILTDIDKFQQVHLDIDVEIIEHTGNSIAKSLENGDFDIAFHDAQLFANNPKIDTVHYNDDYLVAAVNKEHHLAQEDTIKVESLKEERLIFVDKPNPIYNISLKLCQDTGFTPNTSFTGVRLENIFELVSLNKGIAFLSRKVASSNKLNNVYIKELSPTATRNIVMARANSKKLSNEAEKFWNYIAAHRIPN